MTSIYVHFPYCLAKCPYCDFVSYAADRETIAHEGYADAVLREIDARAKATCAVRGAPVHASTIFFGGGTPSLWETSQLGRVLSALRTTFYVPADAEVTVECNPTSLDQAKAEELAEAGVNRLSIGTQSLRAEALRFLGRLHDPDGATRAIEAALATGLRVSTDLIFGLPDQTPEDARDQALRLADLGLRHLSAYQLTIEPGTQFGERKRRGLLPMADDGQVAESFVAIEEALQAKGLEHYEISNYAEPGQRSQHNLSYWRGHEYLGFGCGAVGMVQQGPRGVRWRNAILPADYIKKTNEMNAGALGDGDGLSDSHEPLSPQDLLRERIMLGLRVTEGVCLESASRDLGIDPWTQERLVAIDALSARGRLVKDGTTLRIPKRAWLFTDDTAARLF